MDTPAAAGVWNGPKPSALPQRGYSTPSLKVLENFADPDYPHFSQSPKMTQTRPESRTGKWGEERRYDMYRTTEEDKLVGWEYGMENLRSEKRTNKT